MYDYVHQILVAVSGLVAAGVQTWLCTSLTSIFFHSPPYRQISPKPPLSCLAHTYSDPPNLCLLAHSHCGVDPSLDQLTCCSKNEHASHENPCGLHVQSYPHTHQCICESNSPITRLKHMRIALHKNTICRLVFILGAISFGGSDNSHYNFYYMCVWRKER